MNNIASHEGGARMSIRAGRTGERAEGPSWWERLTFSLPQSGISGNQHRPAYDALKMALPARRTLSETIMALRTRLSLEPYQALFLTVGASGVLAPSNVLLRQLDEKYRDDDGFLYLGYFLENTFG